MKIEPEMIITVNIPISVYESQNVLRAFESAKAIVDKINKEYGGNHTLRFEINFGETHKSTKSECLFRQPLELRLSR